VRRDGYGRRKIRAWDVIILKKKKTHTHKGGRARIKVVGMKVVEMRGEEDRRGAKSIQTSIMVGLAVSRCGMVARGVTMQLWYVFHSFDRCNK
jgi:hypothetical protein